MMLGRRGYHVTLAEASGELGGRVTAERKLPGLSAWGRVADYRVGQISQMANIEVYRGSTLTAEDVLNLGVRYAALATGAKWRRDGVARASTQAGTHCSGRRCSDARRRHGRTPATITLRPDL